jgi:hypothetical protein
MSAADIQVIKSLFPCLENALDKMYGLIIHELSVSKTHTGRNIITLKIMRPIPMGTCIPWHIIMPYPDMIETAAFSLVFARDPDNIIYDDIYRFVWEPSEQFISSFTSFRTGSKKIFEKWWESAKFVIDAQIISMRQLSVFKEELIAKTKLIN